ncbi:MAG: hypothetical protein ACE5D2_06800 [Fidelibacterota bacterium]
MEGKTAGYIFLGICVILAILLMIGMVTPVISGSIFALALVFLGVLSNGFARHRDR